MSKKKAIVHTEVSTRPQKSFLFWLMMIALIFIVIFLSIVGYYAIKVKTYVSAFTTAAQTSSAEILTLAQSGWKTTPKMDQGRVNILLLGTDEVVNREGDPILTDSLMILSLNTQTDQLSALNLPRDLWIPEYQTKINAIYWYGKEKDPDHPEFFTQQVVGDLTGLPIHYTVVLSLDTVAEIIDAMGGVEVLIPKGFIDDRFPRTDVDIRTEKDPAKLYETIEFKEGTELMTGERALKYMRSRKSQDIETGTDDARSLRQQLVISALIQKMKDPNLIKQPEMLGKLFYVYNQKVSTYFPMVDAIGVGKLIGQQATQLQFSPSTLSIKTPVSEGVITHPPVPKYKQWVYEVVSEEAFKKEILQKLHY